MAAPDRWYHHVPPASAVIPCEGEEHRVTWRWGKFKLEDHDLGSERAMLVLGGEAAPCLRALQLWGDQFGMRPELVGEMRRHLGANAVLVPEELTVPRDVGMVLSLERAWKHSRYFDEQGRLIERQLKYRALPAFRAHLTAEKQRFGSRVLRRVELKHVAAGRPAAIEGRIDSVSVSASVTLSSDWIVDVWARGLSAVDGGFVLEVTGGDDEAPSVRAVQWRPNGREAGVAEPAIVVTKVARDGGGWRLTQGGSGR